MSARQPARRAFLTGALALPTAALPAVPVVPVKDAADNLAAAMTARHCRPYMAHVDQAAGFILIQPAWNKGGGE